MPTYEYECVRCGRVFEKFQRISEEPLKRCPHCRGKISRRPGTGAGILFKGSGFYTTDYRSESYRKAAQAEKSSTAGDSKGGGGTDKKGDGSKSGKVESA